MDSFSLKKEILEKKTWAVLGVSQNKERMSYKIWKILKKEGYKAYGVNPKYKEIDGEKINASLKDIHDKVQVISMVLSPKYAYNVLDEAKKLGIEYIFFQPGSYDDLIIEKAQSLDLKFLTGDCIYATLMEKD